MSDQERRELERMAGEDPFARRRLDGLQGRLGEPTELVSGRRLRSERALEVELLDLDGAWETLFAEPGEVLELPDSLGWERVAEVSTGAELRALFDELAGQDSYGLRLQLGEAPKPPEELLMLAIFGGRAPAEPVDPEDLFGALTGLARLSGLRWLTICSGESAAEVSADWLERLPSSLESLQLHLELVELDRLRELPCPRLGHLEIRLTGVGGGEGLDAEVLRGLARSCPGLWSLSLNLTADASDSAAFAEFRALEVLSVGGACPELLEVIAELPLRHLDLGRPGTGVPPGPGSLQHLPATLESLTLAHFLPPEDGILRAADLEPLRRLTALTELDCEGVTIDTVADLDALRALPKLTRLRLVDGHDVQGPLPAPALPDLKILALGESTSRFEGRRPSESPGPLAARATRLIEARLRDSLAPLLALRSLEVHGFTELRDLVEALVSLPKLEVLHVADPAAPIVELFEALDQAAATERAPRCLILEDIDALPTPAAFPARAREGEMAVVIRGDPFSATIRERFDEAMDGLSEPWDEDLEERFNEEIEAFVEELRAAIPKLSIVSEDGSDER